MAKSIRSKTKRKHRTLRRDTGDYASVYKARLERLAEKQAVLVPLPPQDQQKLDEDMKRQELLVAAADEHKMAVDAPKKRFKRRDEKTSGRKKQRTRFL